MYVTGLSDLLLQLQAEPVEAAQSTKIGVIAIACFAVVLFTMMLTDVKELLSCHIFRKAHQYAHKGWRPLNVY